MEYKLGEPGKRVWGGVLYSFVELVCSDDGLHDRLRHHGRPQIHPEAIQYN